MQQNWFYTDDDHIAITGGTQCVDLRDGNKSNGAVIQTWQCSNNANQVRLWRTLIPQMQAIGC